MAKHQVMGQLDNCINDLLRDGKLDSSGSFTLDSHRAIEKLAAGQLADPNWWILKFVQAAVASGAPNLRVESTAHEIRLIFEPGEAWTYELVEKALADPQPDVLPGLDHLKRGLWNCSLHQGHPFQLELVDQKRLLVGMRGQTHYRSGRCHRTALTISHRKSDDGFQLLAEIKSLKRNAELLALVRQRAACVPICFQLPDGILSMRKSDTGLNDTLQLYAVREHLLPLLAPPHQETLSPGGAYVKIAFYYQDKPYLKPRQVQDSLCWVRDGVIVDQEALFDEGSRCVGVQVYASAEGLASDASGMSLVHSETRVARGHLVRLRVAESFQLGQLFSEFSVVNKKGVLQTYAAVVMGSGGAGWWGMGMGGGIGMGLLAAFLAGLLVLPMIAGDWGSTVVKHGTRDAVLMKRAAEAWFRRQPQAS